MNLKKQKSAADVMGGGGDEGCGVSPLSEGTLRRAMERERIATAISADAIRRSLARDAATITPPATPPTPRTAAAVLRQRMAHLRVAVGEGSSPTPSSALGTSRAESQAASPLSEFEVGDNRQLLRKFGKKFPAVREDARLFRVNEQSRINAMRAHSPLRAGNASPSRYSPRRVRRFENGTAIYSAPQFIGSPPAPIGVLSQVLTNE
jgi:hypothetical protein